jgi:polysaccharide biosynthesis protein VpsM
MPIKNLIRLTLIAVVTLTCSRAAPFLAIGDGAELFITGELGVKADDNIYLAANAENDLVFNIDPGLELVFGRGAQLKGTLTLVESFTNYSDNSSLNSNLFSGDFVSNYDDGKLKMELLAKFHELNQNVFDIRSLPGLPGAFVRRDILTLGGHVEVEVSQLSSVRLALEFEDENFKQRGYTDLQTLEVPLNWFYRWSPKTDLGFGYRYRDTSVDVGQDSTDHFFNVGARGEYSPKLSGHVAVGLNARRLQNGDDETQLGLEAKLRYELSMKTSLVLGVTNDFGTGPRGEQEENFVVHLSARSRIADEWEVETALFWRSIDYSTRRDDFWEFQLGAGYIISANVRLVGGYVYRQYGSPVSSLEFKNNVFSLGANFRY